MANSYKFEWRFSFLDDSQTGSATLINKNIEIEAFRGFGGQQKFLYYDGRESVQDRDIGDQFTLIRHSPILFLKIEFMSFPFSMFHFYNRDYSVRDFSFSFDFKVTNLSKTSKFKYLSVHGEDAHFWSPPDLIKGFYDAKLIFSNPAIRYFHTIDGGGIMTDEWKDGQKL